MRSEGAGSPIDPGVLGPFCQHNVQKSKELAAISVSMNLVHAAIDSHVSNGLDLPTPIAQLLEIKSVQPQDSSSILRHVLTDVEQWWSRIRSSSPTRAVLLSASVLLSN
ncbi:hypothetical protein CEXT_21921 [Caerostris extrusa]|uniref:Uncharacterized protein n=1 Tax=Caerostris extrusa TaxID=172846 RepID=A0AAV4MJM1_CAEEX|nr:hypothetical protein CEXT_21921 [Caerostris extrusa]